MWKNAAPKSINHIKKFTQDLINEEMFMDWKTQTC